MPDGKSHEKFPCRPQIHPLNTYLFCIPLGMYLHSYPFWRIDNGHSYSFSAYHYTCTSIHTLSDALIAAMTEERLGSNLSAFNFWAAIGFIWCSCFCKNGSSSCIFLELIVLVLFFSCLPLVLVLLQKMGI